MLSFLERHVVVCLIGAVAAVFAIYEISVLFVAYSGEAYVESNVILIAPEVSGPLASIAVRDDQVVTQGALIAEIDRTPFELAVAVAQTQVKLAADRAHMAQDAIAESQASLAASQASAADAQLQLTRAETLTRNGDMAAEGLDAARRNALVSAADVRKAQGQVTVTQNSVTVSKAEQDAAARALDQAQYNLSRTRIVSPVAGRVAPMSMHTGDYAHAGQAIAAVVSSEDWRIMASMNERHLARLRPGQTVWFTVGSDPWRLHRGAVRAIAPGVARAETPERALPYVPLETDWIRLPRRFPIVVDMGDLPKTLPLFRGADARVWVWF